MKKFIESLSQWFGIDKETTATIVITVFVFVIGIILEWLRKRITSYFNNRSLRNSVRKLVFDMSRSCRRQAELVQRSMSEASLINNKDFIISSVVIQGLPSLLEMKMEELIRKFNTPFNKKIKGRAISKLHETVLILDRIEIEIERMLNMINDRVNKHETIYQQNLDGLRRLNDSVITDLSMKGLASIPTDSLVGDLLSTFRTWKENGANTDISKTHEFIICKLFEAATKRKPEPLGFEIINLSLAAKLAYVNLDKLETMLKQMFKNNYYSYRKAYRMASKILEII